MLFAEWLEKTLVSLHRYAGWSVFASYGTFSHFMSHLKQLYILNKNSDPVCDMGDKRKMKHVF